MLFAFVILSSQNVIHNVIIWVWCRPAVCACQQAAASFAR